MSKEALKEAFVFTYDRMRRFQGEWHLERQLMFPAHVFLDSDDEAALTEELRCCAVMDVLSKEKGAILYVRKNEERFLTSTRESSSRHVERCNQKWTYVCYGRSVMGIGRENLSD